MFIVYLVIFKLKLVILQNFLLIYFYEKIFISKNVVTMKSFKKHIYEFYPDTMPTEIEVSKHMYYYYCNRFCNEGYNWIKRIFEYPDRIEYRLTIWKKTNNNEQNTDSN